MNVAIIPARGGSKRIPKKNIKTFVGKPLIAYSIEVAKASGLFSRIIVSTDSDEVAQVALKYGAEVPFIRPENLADDFTGTNAVVHHALKWLKNSGIVVDFACCIYATAPLLQKEYLQQAYDKLITEKKSYVFPVTEYVFPIQRAFYLKNLSYPVPVDEKSFKSRSQDLQQAYHDAGQFYWGKPYAFQENYHLFSEQTEVLQLPKHLVCDIDTEADFFRAELQYKIIKKMNKVNEYIN